jgi:imidazolonepropionase-like amidohydrolase
MVRTVFRGGEVFDGTPSALRTADVAVENGLITAVGTGLDGDEVVDCTGMTVMPGMFDCHVHMTMAAGGLNEALERPFSLEFFEAARAMERTLEAGITSVRDAGGADRGIRVAQERGLIRGPRIQVSLNMVSQTGGHGELLWPSGSVVDFFVPHPGRPSVIVDGPDEMRKKIRELVRAGADVIKVAASGGSLSPGSKPWMPHFRDEELRVLVEEATAAGIFVMAHANGEGAKNAVRNGIRSIEHGAFLDDETLAMMVERGTWLVPTLSASEGLLTMAELGAAFPEQMLEKVRLMAAELASSTRRAVEAGVKIAMGTDVPLYPHGKNLRELELMAGCGMTPEAVLHAATLSAAELMGVDGDLGSLEAGKKADLLLIDGSALEITGIAERVRSVYQDGVLVHESVPA